MLIIENAEGSGEGIQLQEGKVLNLKPAGPELARAGMGFPGFILTGPSQDQRRCFHVNTDGDLRTYFTCPQRVPGAGDGSGALRSVSPRAGVEMRPPWVQHSCSNGPRAFLARCEESGPAVQHSALSVRAPHPAIPWPFTGAALPCRGTSRRAGLSDRRPPRQQRLGAARGPPHGPRCRALAHPGWRKERAGAQRGSSPLFSAPRSAPPRPRLGPPRLAERPRSARLLARWVRAVRAPAPPPRPPQPAAGAR